MVGFWLWLARGLVLGWLLVWFRGLSGVVVVFSGAGCGRVAVWVGCVVVHLFWCCGVGVGGVVWG